ncbi:Hypothetical protein, putative [Bodo saltans]|uniref:Survival motor neuron Tudor domain-containing protein n=1 Tax=Bodo saltans TaxID=75058 RepID=A0A0S4IN09_BODSA|nr:Hypothetical protein, putative [Bodo saltans]|eukprot:CUF58295.1 Hypothetical protein, putative [Bodo saltans]
MSTTTSIFNRAAGDAEATTAVWDDSELIAAWNAQLKRIQTEKSKQVVIESGEAEDTNSTVSNDDEDEDEDDEESEMSGAEVALDMQLDADDVSVIPATNPSGASNNRKRLRDEECHEGDAVLRLMPPIPPGVGSGMVAMLRAWFSAGYETGRYISSTADGSKKQ